MRINGTSIEQLNAIGKKVGLTLYYNASEDVRLRPGLIHISDGTRHHVITVSDEITLSSHTFGSGSDTYPTSGTNNSTWVYVTVDINGTLRLHISTGTDATTNTARPDDSYYAWAGYKHLKAGYYYNSTERIIGVIYRNNSATDWFAINQGSEADEEGENANGYWNAKNDGTMECWGLGSSVDITSGSGGAWSTGNLTFTFPREFLDTNVSANVMAENTDSWGGGINITSTQLGYRLNSFASRTGANPIYHAIGRWRA
jgi:hypothetical protein